VKLNPQARIHKKEKRTSLNSRVNQKGGRASEEGGREGVVWYISKKKRQNFDPIFKHTQEW
jgi:hypothetical protein